MHSNSPHDSSQADIRRTASGAIDTDYYHRCARVERGDFLRVALSCIARCGWRVWGYIKKKMEDQFTRQQLSVLSTRELKDIGLARGDIDAIANGAYATDQTRCSRSRERLGKCA
jgi:uncharacterized protein YjiS (DUF1127 family)